MGNTALDYNDELTASETLLAEAAHDNNTLAINAIVNRM